MKKRKFSDRALSDHKEIGPSQKSRWWRKAIIYFSIFLAGVLLSSLVWSITANSEIDGIANRIKPVYQKNNSYQFIDPLLAMSVPDDVQSFNEYQPLAKDINNLVASESAQPDSFGVYFRDMSSSHWAGINENVAFAPGSMMKVVLMIAYFKKAEDDPSILQQTLTYSSAVADQLNGIPFETPSNLKIGESYTVEQLIEAMIENSDNGAKNALLDNISPTDLSEITTDLSISYLDLTKDYSSYSISAKQYSLILRVLYNATYLSRDYSEKALQIMSQAQYNQGLLAGVPASTTVAQKFGESVDGSNPSTPEITLSNCGIVYYPEHPYILCVMTKGKNVDNLAHTIAAISHLTWSEMTKVNK